MCDHSPNREAAMVIIERDSAGTPTVWCDPCIAPLVAALNAGGLPTLASCCGHGHRPGRVTLRDGRELMIHPDMASVERASAVFTVDINGDRRTPTVERITDGNGDEMERGADTDAEAADQPHPESEAGEFPCCTHCGSDIEHGLHPDSHITPCRLCAAAHSARQQGEDRTDTPGGQR